VIREVRDADEKKSYLREERGINEEKNECMFSPTR